MKKYLIFLICSSIIVTVACTIREYHLSQETDSVIIEQDDEHAHLHKTINNSELLWNLVLINSQNRLPENFNVVLKETSNGEKIDERIYPFLEEMLLDAKKAGHSPEITSGYRSEEKQKQLLDDKIKEYRSAGYSKKEAKKIASKQVSEPGFSEHGTGLAVDINSASENSWELYGWLNDNCHKYGFIVRYPEGKEEITGIKYEPWHLRFVGKETAKYIYETGITLEEYILL